MSAPTFSLVLAAAEAEQLFRLVSIGELAMHENYEHGWLPKLSGDATLFATYLKQHAGGPSLERPFGELREWLRQQERRTT